MKRVAIVAKEPQVSLEDIGEGIVININPEWRMLWDGCQFKMQRRRMNKTGKKQGRDVWISEAFITNLDNAIVWLARKQIFAIKGEYEIEALEKLCETLDAIKGECIAALREAIRVVPPSGLIMPGARDA